MSPIILGYLHWIKLNKKLNKKFDELGSSYLDTYRAVGAGFEQCSCSTPHAVTHEHRRVSTVTACRLWRDKIIQKKNWSVQDKSLFVITDPPLGGSGGLVVRKPTRVQKVLGSYLKPAKSPLRTRRRNGSVSLSTSFQSSPFFHSSQAACSGAHSSLERLQ